jgi:hypothetical protein
MMANQHYILRREVTHTHPKTGLPVQHVSYFEKIDMFVMATTDPAMARQFKTKALAEFFSRNVLGGRYEPEARTPMKEKTIWLRT